MPRELAAVLRRWAGRACAIYYRLRSIGRVEGHEYLLRKPSLLRVTGPGVIRIGRGTVIDRGARLVASALLEIGEDVYVGKNATIVAMAPVVIGDRALIGENVSLHSEDHGPPGRRSEYRVAPITVGSDSWLAAGVVVLKGVEVGCRATVGANAVVTKDVPADTVAVGIPARAVRSL